MANNDIPGTAAQRMSEIFDVVDLDDNVVGKATRGEVHGGQLIHRATHILVFDSLGNVLLQKRSQWKDTFPGAWTTSCAGHVDSGESYEACAIRELGEELGICVLPATVHFVEKLGPCCETANEWVAVFFTMASGPFQPEAAEVAELKWIAPDALNTWISSEPEVFAPSFVYVWQRCGEVALEASRKMGD